MSCDCLQSTDLIIILHWKNAIREAMIHQSRIYFLCVLTECFAKCWKFGSKYAVDIPNHYHLLQQIHLFEENCVGDLLKKWRFVDTRHRPKSITWFILFCYVFFFFLFRNEHAFEPKTSKSNYIILHFYNKILIILIK